MSFPLKNELNLNGLRDSRNDFKEILQITNYKIQAKNLLYRYKDVLRGGMMIGHSVEVAAC